MKVALFVPLFLASLAMSGIAPASTQPVLAWIRSGVGGSVSVGYTAVYVAVEHSVAEVRSYDFEGSLQWTRRIGTYPHDMVLDVAVGPDSVYVVGIVGGEGLLGPRALEGRSFVQRLGFDGELIWVREFGEQPSYALAVSVEAASVYVAGRSSEAGYVRKYDSDGVELWTSEFRVVGVISVVSRVSAGPRGVYVLGETRCHFHQLCDGESNFIKALDHLGNELWSQQFNAADFRTSVSAGTTGIYVLAPGFVTKHDFDGNLLWLRDIGSSRAALGLSSSPLGVYVVGFVYAPVFGDAFVSFFDSNGNAVWTLQFGPGSCCASSSPIASSPMGIFVTGGGFSIAKVCLAPSCLHK